MRDLLSLVLPFAFGGVLILASIGLRLVVEDWKWRQIRGRRG